MDRKKRDVPPVIKIDGEIEANIIALTCSSAPEGRTRRIPAIEEMTAQVPVWARGRNARKDTVHWHFTTQDARIKLQHLYPKI